MALFYNDINGNIVRFSNNFGDIGLIVSPCDNNIDKRVNKSNITLRLSEKEAHEELNRRWDKYCDKWTRNSKKYRASSVIPDVEEIKEHELTVYSNVTRPFVIVQFQGELYWADVHTSHLPTCPLYEFISEEEHGSFCCWAEIQHLKPVFCITDKQFI